MKTNQKLIPAALGVALVVFAVFVALRGAAADPAAAPVPAIVQDGFAAWSKQGASYAFDIWKKGGLLELDRKPSVLANYFRQADRLVGDYRAYELIDTKRVCASSEILYVSVNFAHAAIYGRFLLYHTDKDWVVQNMDFSPRPEQLMSWLSYEGVDYGQ